jgi:hypothetical protein
MLTSLNRQSAFIQASQLTPRFSGTGDHDDFWLNFDSQNQSGFDDIFDLNHMTLSTGLPGLSSADRKRKERERQIQELQPTLDGIVSKFSLPPADAKRLQQLTESYFLIQGLDTPQEQLTQALNSDKFDLKAFEADFLRLYFADKGVYVDKISPDQIGKWNLKYLPELSEELTIKSPYQSALKSLCLAALQGNYPAYLHDPNTAIGQNNLRTKEAFAKNGLDYTQWLNYTGSVKTQKPGLTSIQHRLEQIFQAMAQTNPSSLNKLYFGFKNSGFQFKDGYLIDTRPAQNVAPRLIQLINALPFDFGAAGPVNHDLDDRHFGLSFTPQGRKTLTGLPTELLYLGEVHARLVSSVRNLMKNSEPAAITIRQWDREPGKDLFQANDTGSCIALGFGRGKGSLDVMENTFVQLGEFYNHAEEKVTGKALFFWCKDMDQDGEPVLIINTLEGRDSGCEEDPSAQKALLDYAKGLSKAVSGRDNVRIFTAHHQWNPLYKGQGKEVLANLHPIGDSVTGKYYFDTFGSHWVRVNQIHQNVPIVELLA